MVQRHILSQAPEVDDFVPLHVEKRRATAENKVIHEGPGIVGVMGVEVSAVCAAELAAKVAVREFNDKLVVTHSILRLAYTSRGFYRS